MFVLAARGNIEVILGAGLKDFEQRFLCRGVRGLKLLPFCDRNQDGSFSPALGNRLRSILCRNLDNLSEFCFRFLQLPSSQDGVS